MEIEDVEVIKFIHPNDEWQCFICRRKDVELSEFAENGQEVFLICEPCRNDAARKLLEDETLKNL